MSTARPRCARGAVARRLLADGYRVRVVTRDEAKGERRRRAGADVVGGRFAGWASLKRASGGVDAIVFLVLPSYDCPLAVGHGHSAAAAGAGERATAG